MNTRWKIAQAAEIRWWQQYLRHKPTDDYLAWKHSYWQEFLQNLSIQVPATASILDAGCGPAGVFMVFPAHEVVALDPLLDEYEEKLAHFSKAHYPNVSFINSPLEKMTTTRQFDVVFCLNAINHVADLSHSFDLLVKAVKPGGTLVVSIDAHNYAFFKHLFRLLPGDILHPHQYDLAEYTAMLTSRNITINQQVLIKPEFFFDYYALKGIKESK